MAAAVLTGGSRPAGGTGESLAPRVDEDGEEEMQRAQPVKKSASSPRTRRCEAFVMTGDKMLNLNPNISSSYAKVARDQLPPKTKIEHTPRSHFSQLHFPSSRRGRLLTSQSQPEGVTIAKRERPVNPTAEATAEKEEEKLTRVAREAEKERDVREAEKREREEAEAEPATSMRSTTTSSSDSPPQPPRHPSMVPSGPHHQQPTMISSIHSNAFSNPQINERTASTETFTVSVETPSKMSSVTINNGMSGGERGRTPGSKEKERRPTSPPTSLPGGRREEWPKGLPPHFPHSPSPSTPSVAIQRALSTTETTSMASPSYIVLSSWAGTRIDAALRELLSQVELRGETSQREKVICHFSRRYHNANPTLFPNLGADAVHALACGLLLLNADLHGEARKKMSCREFIVNMAHSGHDYQRTLLKTLYESIKHSPLSFDGKSTEDKKQKRRARLAKEQRSVLELDPQSQVEYKRGFLLRKVVYDSDGTPTPLGRRGWRMVFVRVRGLALYFSRDETEPCLYATLANALLLHHALAEPAVEYTKKKHVFRLQTAALGEMLFQTTSSFEVSAWLDAINTVAASFSSRALPPGLDSAGRLLWPPLPRAPSGASLAEQLAAHDASAAALSEELTRLRSAAPPLKARGKAVEQYFFDERLLMHEIQRYTTYASLLRARLSSNGSSDSGIVSKASGQLGEDGDNVSYREALHMQACHD